MSHYTPGPWKVRNLGTRKAWEGYGCPYTIATEDGRLLARGSQQAGETMANARLLAAAPALLKAAKAAVDWIECFREPSWDCEAQVTLLYEAIRKAETDD